MILLAVRRAACPKREGDAEKAADAELEDGVDDEGWCTEHDLDDDNSEYDVGSHCRLHPIA